MNKILKKVTAVVGVAVVGVAALAGCTKAEKKAATMFDVVEAASEVKQFT